MHQRKISVVGLGYVGLPVAVAFGHKYHTIAFDINQARVEALKQGIDITGEVTTDELSQAEITYTYDPSCLKEADFHIVAVPTPVGEDKRPDLTPLLAASKTVGEQLKSGDIVVFESTVYPGATEEDCVPILEKYSGLKCGEDFYVGYSPERINPGDRDHTFTKIKKVVSGQTPEICQIIADVYASVVEAGVHVASSIKVAEAAKVIENTQRDLNIALINELSIIFNKMDINTHEVLEAAGSKWNFLPFKPGLVGGHCIGVDPYYLTHKAVKLGLNPEVILAGRRTNDGMGKFIAEQTIKKMVHQGVSIKGANVAILGLTFKENCPDLRNTKVTDVIAELESYGVNVHVHDPMVDKEEAFAEYGLTLKAWDEVQGMDALVVAVAHEQYVRKTFADFQEKLGASNLIIDVKNMFKAEEARAAGLDVWQL